MSGTKPGSNKKFCKALDCTADAQVRGYCRLHFLQVLKAKERGEELDDNKEASLDASKGHDRRSARNRLKPVDAPTETDPFAAEVDDRLNHMGTMELDDLTSIVDGEDLDGLKKTGS